MTIRNSWKRIIAGALAVLVVAGAVTSNVGFYKLTGGTLMTAYADIPTSVDFGENNALHWKLNDGTLTISGTGAMPDYNYDDPYNIWRDYLGNTAQPLCVRRAQAQ
ncbi:MAG: hypothetical protein IKP47_08595 [Ruminococcus sp.]|nr:hypothetical protein [Ruminococcus sp.]